MTRSWLILVPMVVGGCVAGKARYGTDAEDEPDAPMDVLSEDVEDCEAYITGWLIDEAEMCADHSQVVVMGCKHFMVPIHTTVTCYQNAETDIHVYSGHYYSELVEQGWVECDETFRASFFSNPQYWECP